MRSSPTVRVVLAGAAALSVALAGCTSPQVVTAPASSAAGSPASPSPSARTAAVGDTLELAGRAAGARMAVTVTQVVDPADPANDIGSPSPGTRLVAVQFRLHNTGSATYSDSPSNGAQLIDDRGQGFPAEIADVTSGPAFPGIVHLAPGDTALGYVSFLLPVPSRPARVQFTLDSGFADQTGQWAVPAGAAAGTAPAAGGRSATTAAPATPATPSASAATGPAQVVGAYYAAINAHDYRRAWDLGGRNLAPGYQAFVDGFAGTAAVTPTVTGVSGDTVFVVIDARQDDGSHRVFSGSYTVRDGAIVSASVR